MDEGTTSPGVDRHRSVSAHLIRRATECSFIPAKIIASCFALTGFIAALVVGLAAGNSATTILWNAILAMAVCYPVGRVLGGVAERAVQENIDNYKKRHPLPKLHPSADEEEAQPADASATSDEGQPPARAA
ncbi:MAG: hypothetical protein IT442_03625 [Phycisphaeraceae bacterium]|nr:hypothetical protein [Phycisphaeraceae bacterium]